MGILWGMASVPQNNVMNLNNVMLVPSRIRPCILNIKPSSQVSPRATHQCHNVDICSLKEITFVDEWNHLGNKRA